MAIDVSAKNLDRDRAAQSRVARSIYLAHAPGSERRLDFIRTDAGADLDPHRFTSVSHEIIDFLEFP